MLHPRLMLVLACAALAPLSACGAASPRTASPDAGFASARVYNGSGADVEMSCRLQTVVYPLGKVRAGATEVFVLPVRGCVPFSDASYGYGTSGGIRVQMVREAS
ncbi:hypothetical protein [Longimicrobium sp.]|uniref:hypothetical protein n=1 Tax=Longimicrobium sp. TaxID=2029185 RepID=UPI002EDBB6B0